MIHSSYDKKLLNLLTYYGIISADKYDVFMECAHDRSSIFILGIAKVINDRFLPEGKDGYLKDALIASYLSAVVLMSNKEYKQWYFENTMRAIGALDMSIDPDPDGG